MSLGGLTTIALAGQRPDLVRAARARRRHARGRPRQGHGHRRRSSTARRASPASTSCSPARSSSTRPGPSRRCGAASCTTPCSATTAPGCGATGASRRRPRRRAPEQITDFAALWDDASARSRCRCMLVRGMRPQSVVDDGDEAELLRRRPHGRGSSTSTRPATASRATRPVELAATARRLRRRGGGECMSERVFERTNHQARSSAHWCTAIGSNVSNDVRVHQ